MSTFDEILSSVADSDIEEKVTLTEYLITVLGGIKKLQPEDRDEIAEFVSGQVNYLLEKIPQVEEFREKDRYCAYGQRLTAIYPMLFHDSGDIPEEALGNAQELVRVMREAQPIDDTLDRIFDQDKIEEAYIDRLLSYARGASCEYEKGKLYSGLLEYRDRLSGITGEAKNKLAAYFEEELDRYLHIEKPDKDVIDSWEVAADAAKYFPGEKTGEILTATLGAGHSCISFFAVETLIALGAEIPRESILPLAADTEYANLTHELLEEHGLLSLFPQEYSSPEYLAKSDMVHWLTYPTELGKAPDEIELIGKVKYFFGKDEYYVFRYRSDSENLGDELKGKWLIGWSSENGETFSNFDPLEKYEKESPEKTLKNIKKHAIGR